MPFRENGSRTPNPARGPGRLVEKLRPGRDWNRSLCWELESARTAMLLSPSGGSHFLMRLRPEGPRIPVPIWLIELSKSRDLFLSLAHDPWVFRPN